MDIVLEQLMQYVDEIAGLVSDSAPVVWEMVMKQVRVQIAGHVVCIVAGIILVVGVVFYTRWYRKHSFGTYDMKEMHIIAMVILGAISAPLTLCSLYEVIARLINPSWYAIKLLLKIAGIGG